VFGLTIEKLLIIGVIAVFLIGPQKLPLYAQKLGALVRAVRDFTDTAKARVAEELGPDFTDTDWQKLDPRRYDPRQIVRQALTDDPAPDQPGTVAPTPPSTASPSRSAAPGGWQETLLARVGHSHWS
jgi:sec-independent protein translocase protein TatB